jgi:hypothetical protein
VCSLFKGGALDSQVSDSQYIRNITEEFGRNILPIAGVNDVLAESQADSENTLVGSIVDSDYTVSGFLAICHEPTSNYIRQ